MTRRNRTVKYCPNLIVFVILAILGHAVVVVAAAVVAVAVVIVAVVAAVVGGCCAVAPSASVPRDRLCTAILDGWMQCATTAAERAGVDSADSSVLAPAFTRSDASTRLAQHHTPQAMRVIARTCPQPRPASRHTQWRADNWHSTPTSNTFIACDEPR